MRVLEEILKNKEDEGSKQLYSQWIYDKQIYEDILTGVGEYYSHFTDHGANHSKTILENIVAILGEEVFKELSSTDIWLLLSSSYLHDCGMYLSVEDVNKTLESQNFKDYFTNILLDDKNILYREARNFEINEENNKIVFKENLNYRPEIDYSMKFIVASYKRAEHGELSKGKIPKRTLIPNRINNILGLIASSHNFSFKEIEQKLSPKERGLGDECHPQFISYLLRMGDLLDLDGDRMSPRVFSNIKSFMPQDSKDHISKHKSISHIEMNTKKIEVTATIKRFEEDEDRVLDIYDKTKDWFDWIKEEHNNQVLRWNKVKPEGFTGSLPYLGELKINLEGFELIDGDERPRFGLDHENVFEILKGAGIYNGEEDSIRELLQNAIDATLLRIHLEEEDSDPEYRSRYQGSVDLQEVRDRFDKYAIRVEINKDEEKSKLDEKNDYWNIKIIDKGIGIQKSELKYLQNTGSSSRNTYKKNLIRNMPMLLQPSGNFGIGFQSIFMLTDEVSVYTKSMLDNSISRLRFYSPTGKRKGDILYEKVKHTHKKEIGTEVSFVLKTEKEEGITIDEWDRDKDNQILEDIKYIVEKTNTNSLVKIERNYKIHFEGEKRIGEINVYTKEKLSLNYEEDLNTKDCFKNNFGKPFLFKNIEVSECYAEEQLLKGIMKDFKINIIGKEAKELLKVDRNSFKKNVIEDLKIEVVSSIGKYIVENISLFKDDYLKFKIGMFEFYYKKDLENLKINLPKMFSESYKKYKLSNLENENVELKTLEDYSEEKVLEIFVSFQVDKERRYVKLNDTFINGATFDMIINYCFSKNRYNWEYQKDRVILVKTKNKESKLDISYKSRLISWGWGFYIEKEFKKFKNLVIKTEMKYTKERTCSFYPSSKEMIFYKLLNDLYSLRLIIPCMLISKDKKTCIWNLKRRERYINLMMKYANQENHSREEVAKEVDELVEYLKTEYELELVEKYEEKEEIKEIPQEESIEDKLKKSNLESAKKLKENGVSNDVITKSLNLTTKEVENL